MKRAIWAVAAVIGAVAVGLVASLVAGEPAPEGLATVAASGSSADGGVTTTSASTSSTSTWRAPATTASTARLTTTAVPTTVAATTSTGVPITTASTAVTTTTSTTSDPSAAPGPVCQPSMFSTTVTMAKPSYRVGEAVEAASAFRNVSGQTCYLTSTMGGYRILDAGGEPATLPLITVGDHFRWLPVPAGGTETHNWTWDQRVCRPSVPCVPALPGRYTFAVDLQPYGSGRATFDITA